MPESFTFSKAPKQSLKNIAYESIKTAIVKGDLQPGTRLLEADIAAQMGISRGPVREAIRQLDQEGLTYSHPHRGTVVLEMNKEETEKVFVPTRRLIESFVAENAYQILTKKDYENLESIISQMEYAYEADNPIQSYGFGYEVPHISCRTYGKSYYLCVMEQYYSSNSFPSASSRNC